MIVAAMSVAAAGDQPPPLRLGEAVKVSNQKGQVTATGWIRWGRGGWGFTLYVEKATDKVRAGEDLEVTARAIKVDGKDRPVEQESLVYRQFCAGDRVEVELVEEEKRLRATSVKLLYQAPRKGTLAGKVVKIESKENPEERSWFEIQTSAVCQGMEHVKGLGVRFFIEYVNTGDKNKGHRGWILSPEQVKAYSALKEGDLLEITYKADGRFRIELPLKKTGQAEPDKKTDPPKHEPKKDPPPEKRPPPKDEDF